MESEDAIETLIHIYTGCNIVKECSKSLCGLCVCFAPFALLLATIL